MRIRVGVVLGLLLLLIAAVAINFPTPKTCHTVTVTCYR